MKTNCWKILMIMARFDNIQEIIWKTKMIAEQIGILPEEAKASLKTLRNEQLVVYTKKFGYIITEEGRELIDYAKTHPWLDACLPEWRRRAQQGINSFGHKARIKRAVCPKTGPEVHISFYDLEDEMIERIDSQLHSKNCPAYEDA
jgi:hypothetical protein